MKIAGFVPANAPPEVAAAVTLTSLAARALRELATRAAEQNARRVRRWLGIIRGSFGKKNLRKTALIYAKRKFGIKSRTL